MEDRTKLTSCSTDNFICADAVRHLRDDPADRALAERLLAELAAISPDAELPSLPGESRTAPHLLIFGGSQGARIFNTHLPKVMAALLDDRIKDIDGIESYKPAMGSTMTYWKFCLRVDDRLIEDGAVEICFGLDGGGFGAFEVGDGGFEVRLGVFEIGLRL